PLSEAGGKGLFVKEIEDALLHDEIDLAVHSSKDMPARLPSGLVIAGVLPREDPHDAVVLRDQAGLLGPGNPVNPPGLVSPVSLDALDAMMSRLGNAPSLGT